MKRSKCTLSTVGLPGEIARLVSGAPTYDSSCSAEARVTLIDRGCGYFLKRAPLGTLAREASMTEYFHSLGLGARVLYYESADEDFLLTERLCGEDGTHESYLAEPVRLADTMGQMLRALHEHSAPGCPVKNRLDSYFELLEENHARGMCDLSFGNFATAEDAYRVAVEGKRYLKADTLIHGDFCLPNFIMDNWELGGFIDLGGAGIGDRHIDLFWGGWTLNYNLKTDIYRGRFFDAYGRDKIDPAALEIISACEVFG